MELYSRAQARRALFHTVAFRAISQIATMLSFLVLVRELSEQSLGLYNLLYSIIPLIGTVASLGLDQVLRRFQPEYLQSGNLSGAAWLTAAVTRLRFISNLAVLAAVAAAWSWIAPLFHLTGHFSDFELFTLVVVLYFQTVLLQSTLASHMLQRYSAGSIAVMSIAKLLSYFVLSKLLSLTLQSAILADALSFALCYAFLIIAYRRMCKPQTQDGPFRPSADERRRLRRYAIANNFNESSSLLLYVQTDNLFIAALMNQVAVGAYSTYARINEMASSLVPTRLFESVVQPLFFSTKPEDAAERLPRYVTFMININMLVQWPLLAFTAVYHREIMLTFFHGKFVEYSMLLPLIVVFSFTNNVISTPITMVALYAERASLILKSQLFGIYQIAAMFALIPIAGIYGAAIATGTLHLFRNLWVWGHVRKTARWTNVRVALLCGAAIWIPAAVICDGFRLALKDSPLAGMSMGASVCIAASVLFVRSAAISRSDREILGNVLHGRESAILRWIGIHPAAKGISG